MDIKQALEIIKAITGRVQATRDEHNLVVQAIQVIEDALKEDKE